MLAIRSRIDSTCQLELAYGVKALTAGLTVVVGTTSVVVLAVAEPVAPGAAARTESSKELTRRRILKEAMVAYSDLMVDGCVPWL
jgi:hypothetical protein